MSVEAQIVEDLAGMSGDPLRFVLYSFPWGTPGTELEHSLGPERWQVEVLTLVRDGLLDINQAVQIAVASGHGVGKSALVAWLILWGVSTFEDTKGVITANTENQLKTKTWAELAKWFRMFIGRFMFKLTATSIFSADPEHEKTWKVDMVPWSERNTEAFAGLHNQGKRIILIFDEASAIPDVIWETSEGALTDKNTQIVWVVCGNPTRNSGRFRDCHERLRARWKAVQVDSRSVTLTNKEQIARWMEDYGEDDDFVRVRVLGIFPRAGTVQFISSELVDEAAARQVEELPSDALVIGVDVARFGTNSSVIYIRKGRDARTTPPIELRGASTMELAARVAALANELRPDGIFVDGGGVGGGVVDRLRQLNVRCFDISFGSKSDQPRPDNDHIRFANKRAEMWGAMREWLSVGAIPESRDLRAQLIGPEYGFNIRDEIQLEKKEHMAARGVESPDIADALALTFAYQVEPARLLNRFSREPKRQEVLFEYDPFELARTE